MVQNVDVVGVEVVATPNGIGSISMTSIKMDGSLVTQTFAPESAIDVADRGGGDDKPTTVIGCVLYDAVWWISGWYGRTPMTSSA